MTDREKLIGLIDQVCEYSPVDFMHPYGAEIIADHLIANGVTVQEWIPVKEKLPENQEQPILQIKLKQDKPENWIVKEDLSLHEKISKQ